MHYGQHAESDRLINFPISKPRIMPFSGGTMSPVIGDSASAAFSRLRNISLGTAWVEKTDPSLSQFAVSSSPSEEEALFDRLVSLKIQASQISMHMEEAWRSGLFKQLDCLLDHENWHFEDRLPGGETFRTLLRALLFNKLKSRPGLGVTAEGNIIAAWTAGKDRLTIECLPQDKLRYSLIKYVDGDRISAAGQAPAQLILRYLEPYEPEVWFGKD